MRVPESFKFNGNIDKLKQEGEVILCNSATKIYKECLNNNRLYTLTKKGYVDCDGCPILVATVSKEQLYMWIVEIRLCIINDLKKIIADGDYTDPIKKLRRWENIMPEFRDLSFELNTSCNSDIDKMLVSDSSSYEYMIFNFISIYKNFDFGEYQLVLYGY